MTENRHYRPIADYGLIGAMHTCALVSTSGSIDWCCLPSFDSPATFGRILDWSRGGYFQLAPLDVQSTSRRYLPGTNVLETTFNTSTGVATLTDFMPVHPPSHSRMLVGSVDDSRGKASGSGAARVHHPRAGRVAPTFASADDDLPEAFEVQFDEKVVRILECVDGRVQFKMDCCPRFGYGTILPRLAMDESGVHFGLAHGGANALLVYCSAPLQIIDQSFRSEGRLTKGRRLYAVVTSLSHFSPAFATDAQRLDTRHLDALLERTIRFWEGWSSECDYKGDYQDAVLRSALVLKALTYEPTGAIVAAPTTSLPETLGGERNWDYRFTWIRDATFSLKAFFDLGLTREAEGFKNWLEWSTAYPEDLQLMYGVRGERWLGLVEQELPLEGYLWSKPVRVGNGAATQFQLDIYGELMDSAYLYLQRSGEQVEPEYLKLLRDVVEFAVNNWRRPDAGIWETRGGDRHFVFSKVMCWVAMDRGIKVGEHVLEQRKDAELSADVERWKVVRDEIKQDVLLAGYDPQIGAFVQSYGSRTLDAATLMLPLVGFIEATDPRMRSTIEAIERDLTSPDGLVYRYKGFNDGLSGGEGTFTICSFWLVENLIALGEISKARSLFEKLRGYANDLALFSEEIDTETGEMLGNFPQAFSHLAFIQSAVLLNRAEQAARQVESRPAGAPSEA
jgi:GH15 family glucan-1,4-alpha-glucosidase